MGFRQTPALSDFPLPAWPQPIHPNTTHFAACRRGAVLQGLLTLQPLGCNTWQQNMKSSTELIK